MSGSEILRAEPSPELSVHPAAAAFPMMPDDELHALADSIRKLGLQTPITLLADGTLLDGRNRLRACQLVGVEPTFVTYDGDDPTGFVLAANVNRRHITTGARAMATAIALAADGKRGDGRWKRGSVPADSGRSSTTPWIKAMSEAGLVLDVTPDLAPQVRDGLMALDAAHKAAQMSRSHAENDAKRWQSLLNDAPDLAAKVTEEAMTIDEAQAAWRQRESDAIRDRRDGRTAESLLTMSITPAVATVLVAMQLGEPIDVAPIVKNLRYCADVLEGMP